MTQLLTKGKLHQLSNCCISRPTHTHSTQPLFFTFIIGRQPSSIFWHFSLQQWLVSDHNLQPTQPTFTGFHPRPTPVWKISLPPFFGSSFQNGKRPNGPHTTALLLTVVSCRCIFRAGGKWSSDLIGGPGRISRRSWLGRRWMRVEHSYYCFGLETMTVETK